MTMFIKLEEGQPTGYPVTEENLRMLFPDIAFPPYFVPDMVAPCGFGMYEFTQVPDPSTIPKYKKVIEIAPVKRDDGIYYQQFDIVDMTADEMTEADTNKSLLVRQIRIQGLFMSDWAVLPDSPLSSDKKDEWVKYRQLLRELPNVPGFPWDIEIPTAPQ